MYDVLSKGVNNNNLGDIITTIPNSVDMDMFVNYGGLVLILWNLIAILCTLLPQKIFDLFNGKYEYLDKYFLLNDSVCDIIGCFLYSINGVLDYYL